MTLNIENLDTVMGNSQLDFGDHRVTCKLSADATGGELSVFDVEVEPGGGPPPHIHRNEDETFFILEGRFAVLMGNERSEAGPGDCVFGPRGRLHGWRNVGDTLGRMIVVVNPGGFERFFTDLYAVFRASSGMDAATMEKMLAVAARHGIEMMPPAG